MDEPVAPEPDRKNWTWVISAVCPECGFEAAGVSREQLPAVVREAVDRMRAAVREPQARSRPEPAVWSPLEYGCHVSDVCRVFAGRLELMLGVDDPVFENWDQDDTALAERYWARQPDAVADEIQVAGYHIAQLIATVRPDQWSRPGRRSDGSGFTVESLSRYFAHDLVHHVHDVGA